MTVWTPSITIGRSVDTDKLNYTYGSVNVTTIYNIFNRTASLSALLAALPPDSIAPVAGRYPAYSGRSGCCAQGELRRHEAVREVPADAGVRRGRRSSDAARHHLQLR